MWSILKCHRQHFQIFFLRNDILGDELLPVRDQLLRQASSGSILKADRHLGAVVWRALMTTKAARVEGQQHWRWPNAFPTSLLPSAHPNLPSTGPTPEKAEKQNLLNTSARICYSWGKGLAFHHQAIQKTVKTSWIGHLYFAMSLWKLPQDVRRIWKSLC